jgi:hypothetical protein
MHSLLPIRFRSVKGDSQFYRGLIIFDMDKVQKTNDPIRKQAGESPE